MTNTCSTLVIYFLTTVVDIKYKLALASIILVFMIVLFMIVLFAAYVSDGKRFDNVTKKLATRVFFAFCFVVVLQALLPSKELMQTICSMP